MADNRIACWIQLRNPWCTRSASLHGRSERRPAAGTSWSPRSTRPGSSAHPSAAWKKQNSEETEIVSVSSQAVVYAEIIPSGIGKTDANYIKLPRNTDAFVWVGDWYSTFEPKPWCDLISFEPMAACQMFPCFIGIMMSIQRQIIQFEKWPRHFQTDRNVAIQNKAWRCHLQNHHYSSICA